jgi:hypothetical protein
VKTLPLLLTTVVALLSAACGPSLPSELPPVDFARDSKALEDENGRSLNGRSLNGRSLNGTDLTGVVLGVSYSGVKLASGVTLDTFRLDASHLVGTRGGQTYRDSDFLMAEFVGSLGEGQQVRLRVEGIAPAPAPNADLNTYYLTYVGPDGLRYPACVDNFGAGTSAIPVSGRWNYQSGVPGGGSKIEDASSFTFGCLGAAIAKCVLWGYRPWATLNGVSLAPHHQACTRMVRADFCGDGTSYTQNGKSIDLYDSLGIQQDTDAWQLESVWSPNGAQCFRQYNRSASAVSCYQPSFESNCNQSTPFGNGGLLAVEIP